ncbi:DEAD/DEAH box helicase family protein [Candidatus Tokpelaia sp.]|uniref:DEAD/DEAH box helicase family protein n=1 Tax=Candidatus Tokpelaia sp. TaxID=2233777 RepID=UPI003CC80115
MDWAKYTPESNSLTCISLKTPRDYQETAISRVIDGFKSADRGRLIMACGTGKTFTSLKIAERLRLYPNAAAAKAATNQQKHQGKTELEQAASLAAAKAAEKVACSANIVLFLVPGLALLSQTLREWAAQSQRPITPFAVCSDASAGHVTRKAKEADEIEYIANELDFPPTTEAGALAQAVTKARTQNPQAMQVIFCTYHSMEVVAEAQAKHGLPAIDLVICDEAHRTAGQSKSGEDKSFARILAADFIRAEKRLFMTATPIVYTPASKKAAKTRDITLYSMDNEALYGPLLHSISFSQAIKYGCLCDYKLLLLAVSAADVSKTLQNYLNKDDSGVKLDDATKMVGCYRALAKIGLKEEGAPMQSAIAFAQVIDHSADKVSSKDFAKDFPVITQAFQQAEHEAGADAPPFAILAEHVDGSMSSNEREDKLNFLKGFSSFASTRAIETETACANPVTTHDYPQKEETRSVCRVLSNVRCLSEGVDVPALDAVLFLSGKNSQIEIT